MPIHEKLRHLRVTKNLSQQLIADKLYISQNAYSLIESGKTKIDEQRMLQLAKILDIHPFELLAEDVTHSNFHDKVRNGQTLHVDSLSIDNRELVTQLKAQLAKKDEQIEILLSQIRQLFLVLSLKK